MSPGADRYEYAPPFERGASWGNVLLAAFYFAALATALGRVAPPLDEVYSSVDVPMPLETRTVMLVSRIFLAAWPAWIAIMGAVAWRLRRMSDVTLVIFLFVGLGVGWLVLSGLFKPLLSVTWGIGRGP